MSVINTNVSSLIAQQALAKNNQSLSTSLERLSTGVQINTGADNPSGLIAVQSFNQENTGLTTAINNAGLAGNVVGTAEGGLSEVSNLLTQLQGLVGQAANTGGLSADQISADQLQVDSILNTVNRIAGNTNFEGTHLLNGNLSYVTSSLATSALQNLSVNSAQLPDTGNLTVNVQVNAVAKQAQITGSVGTVSGSAVTLEISGNLGTVELTFASGTTAGTIASAVNAATSQTGVTASGNSSGLALTSSNYGASQFVSVKSTGNSAFTFGHSNETGTDAKVTVNGAVAQVSGLHVDYSGAGLNLSLDLATGLNIAATSKSFYITGGGANFALGSQVNDAGKASLGIADVSTSNLGDAADGYLNTLGSGGLNSLSSSNLGTAQKIINSAIQLVSDLRGRLGAFQDYTIGSTVNALNVAYENSNAAESAIQDTNFASETSNLTRSQILSQAATTVLSQANAAPQQALTLLKGG
jgi:flagellin